MKIECKICGKEFRSTNHLQSHKISTKQYYDKYILKNEADKLCPICGKEKRFKNIIEGYEYNCYNCRKKEIIFCDICKINIGKYGFFRHLKYKHNITLKQYYDKYILKNEADKLCPICGKEKSILSITKGYYHKTCDNKNCINKHRDNIMSKLDINGKSGYDKMSEKMVYTKRNTIDDNGLSIIDKAGLKFGETWNSLSNKKKDEWKENRRKGNIRSMGVDNPWKCKKITKIIQKKRMKTLMKNGTLNNYYSKISQDLFWSIYERLPKKLKKYTYFAELNNENYFYDNINNSYYFYDFVISNIKFCIEFNGDYWHANPEFYKEDDIVIKYKVDEIWNRDKVKNDFIRSKGYELVIVWENEYKNDEVKVLEKVLYSINKFNNN